MTRRPPAVITATPAQTSGTPCQAGCGQHVVWGWRGTVLCQFDIQPIDQPDLLAADYREHRCAATADHPKDT